MPLADPLGIETDHDPLGLDTAPDNDPLGLDTPGEVSRQVRSVLEIPTRFERGLGAKLGDVAAGTARAADIATHGEFLNGPPEARLTMGQQRRAFVKALSDPRYQDALTQAGEDPAKLDRVESLLGPRARLDMARSSQVLRAESAASDATAREQRLQETSALYNWGTDQTKFSRKVFAGSPDIDDTFVSQLAEAAGGMLPDIAISRVPVVGPAIAAGSYGAQAGEQQAQEAIAAGKPEAADIAFLSAAGLGFGSERLIGVAPRFWQLAKQSRLAGIAPKQFGNAWAAWAERAPIKALVLEGASHEAIQEASEQAGQNLIASDLAGYDPGRPLGQDVARSGALGGALGGLAGGAAHLARPRPRELTTARPANDELPPAPPPSEPSTINQPPSTPPSDPLGLEQTPPGANGNVKVGVKSAELAIPGIGGEYERLRQAAADPAATDADRQAFAAFEAINKRNQGLEAMRAELAASQPPPETDNQRFAREQREASAALRQLKAQESKETGTPLEPPAKAPTRETAPAAPITRKAIATQLEKDIAAKQTARDEEIYVSDFESDEGDKSKTVGHPELEKRWSVYRWKGKWIGEDGSGSMLHGKTEAEAIEAAKARVRDDLADRRGTFGANLDNQYEVGPLFEHFDVPAGMTTGGWFRTKWGSWYAEVTSGDDTYKLSVRDHEAARKDMGIPDRSAEVSKNWSPQEVNAALGRLEEWLQRKSGTDISASAGGIKTPLETKSAADKPGLRVAERTESALTKEPIAKPGAAVKPQVTTVTVTAEASKLVKPDAIDAALTKAIEATKIDPNKIQEGVTGAPIWVTRAALNGLLRVVRATYRASRSLPQALQAGIEWLRAQNLPGYSETEAKMFMAGLTDQLHSGVPEKQGAAQPEQPSPGSPQEAKAKPPASDGWTERGGKYFWSPSGFKVDTQKPVASAATILRLQLMQRRSDLMDATVTPDKIFTALQRWRAEHTDPALEGVNLRRISEMPMRFRVETDSNWIARQAAFGMTLQRSQKLNPQGFLGSIAEGGGSSEVMEHRFKTAKGDNWIYELGMSVGDDAGLELIQTKEPLTIGEYLAARGRGQVEQKLANTANNWEHANEQVEAELGANFEKVVSGISSAVHLYDRGEFDREVTDSYRTGGIQPALHLLVSKLASLDPSTLNFGMSARELAPALLENPNLVQYVLNRALGVSTEGVSLTEWQRVSKTPGGKAGGLSVSDSASRTESTFQSAPGKPGEAATPTEASPPVKPDAIDAALTRIIDATKIDPNKLQEGVTGAPIWLTRAALNGLLRVVRATYRATKSLAQAIQAGIEWLRAQNLPGYSETEAKTWLETRITVTPHDDDINFREFHDQMAADQPLPPDPARMVSNLLYDRRTNESDAAFAARVIEAVGGPQPAIDVFTDAANGLPGAVRMMLGQVIIKQLGAQGQHLAAARFYDDTFAAHVTDTAQSLQALNAWLALTPEGKVIWAQNKIRKAAADLVAPNKPDIDAAQKAVEQANQQGIEAATADPQVQANTRAAIDASLQKLARAYGSPVQQAIQLEASNAIALLPSVLAKARAAVIAGLQRLGGKEYAEGLVRSSANAVNSAIERVLTPAERKGATVASIFADLTRSLKEQATQVLSGESAVPPTGQGKLVRLRQLFGNAEQMSRVWSRVREEMEGKLAAMKSLERRLAAIPKAIEALQADKISSLDVAVRTGAVTTPEQTTPEITRSVRQQALDNRNAAIDAEIKNLRREFDQAKLDFQDMLKRAPGWKAILRLSPVEVFGAGILRDVIREELESQGLSLVRMVTNHFAGKDIDPNLRAVPLAEQIAAKTGIDRAQAQNLVDALTHEWKAQVAKEQAKLKERIAQARLREQERAQRIRQSRSIVETEVEAAARKLADIQEAKPAQDRPAIAEFYQRLTANLRRLLPANRADNSTLTDIQLVREAFLNPEQYESVWQQLRAEITARHGIEGMADVTNTLGNVTPAALAESSIDNLIRKELVAMRSNLSRVIRQHYTKQDAQGRALADKLVAEAELTGEAAAALAEAVQRRFAALVTERKRRALEKLLKPVQARGLAKPTMVQKIIEASNMGALSAEQFWQAVQAQLRLPEWSPELAKDIRRQADAIEQIPESQIERRQKAQTELLNTVERAKGVDNLDFGLAFYLTNILTGITTHAKNVLSTSLNTTASLGLELARAVGSGHPGDLVIAWTAIGEGMKKGVGAAGDVLRTGIVTGSRLQKIEAGRVLEISRFGRPGGVAARGFAKTVLEHKLARFLNAWKYNYRAMAAEDLLFFKPAEEVRAALLAKRLARSEGLRGAEATERAREILGYGKPAVDAATAQAAREGLTGSAAKRRMAELLEQARPLELREDARQFALRTTFNNPESYGALGHIAAAVNKLKASPDKKIRFLATITAPFTSIVANVTNESLNYTPIGAARALFARESLVGQKFENLTLEQRRELQYELYAKAALGTGLVAALMLKAASYLDDKDPDFAIYASGPGSDEDRRGWQAAGGIKHSLKIGSRYYSYANTPLALPLAWLGNIHDRLRDQRIYKQRSAERVNESLVSSAAAAFAGMPKVITEQSFLLGLMDVFAMLSEPNAEQSSRTFLRQVTRTASSLVVPNAVRQVDKFFDPKVYEQRDLEGMVINATPFVRGGLGQPSLNALGRPVENPLQSQFTSVAKLDPLVKLLAETGNWPSVPNRNEIYPRVGRAMNDQEFYDYVKRSGNAATSMLEKYRSNGTLTKLEAAPQARMIADIISNERARVRHNMGF